MKNVIRSVCVLLLIAAAGMIFANQKTAARLRVEHDELLSASQEAAKLADENQQIEKMRTDNAEVQRLRAENKDLPKLRNDVTQLRHAVDALNRLRAENERLQHMSAARPYAQSLGGANGIAPGNLARNVFPKESLRDAGLGFPRATLETYYAALTQGNLQRLLQCMSPESAAMIRTHGDSLPETFAHEAEGFTGYEIVGRDQPSSDSIVLHIQLTGTTNIKSVRFTQINNEWKMER